MRDSDYKRHLEKVSRSFAFCIEELKDDFKTHVGLAYLLFRILDTIEDAQWEKSTQQREAFNNFNLLLEDPSQLAPFKARMTVPSAPQAEIELINESDKLLNDFYALDTHIKEPLKRSLKTMAKGMEYFACERKHQVQSQNELNTYCYFVAACIGELLTDWFMPQSSEKTYSESLHFGLFLQKTNILKDFSTDTLEGRNFLVSWEETAQGLRSHAKNAFQYIQKIPQERNDYKIFCAWSLFLGLASYPHIERSYKEKTPFKISRIETWNLLRKIKNKIIKNESLEETYSELIAKLAPTPVSFAPFSFDEALKELHEKSNEARFEL